MQELEKILEEIEEGTHTFELLGRDVDFVAIDWVRDVIRKHMNDGWIPENKQPETCKYTGGSCCWPIDQCDECPKNPESGKE